MYWIPQEEDEDIRQQEVHERLRDRGRMRPPNAYPKNRKEKSSEVTECCGDVNNNSSDIVRKFETNKIMNGKNNKKNRSKRR